MTIGSDPPIDLDDPAWWTISRSVSARNPVENKFSIDTRQEDRADQGNVRRNARHGGKVDVVVFIPGFTTNEELVISDN